MSNNIFNNSIIFDRRLVFILIFLSYVFFPTNNSSLDSYAYAGYVKYNYCLFTPHHLFSNGIIYVLLQPFKYLGVRIDILFFSKIVNSIFQLINLLIFYKILTFLKINEKTKLLYILILAFSFSLWRYGTENETYIIPISFSLLGSYYFLKNIKRSKTLYLILSSLFGVLACLFHQIHFFWWFGILFGFYFYNRRFKTIYLYLIPALLVPLSYILVLIFYEKQELTIFNIQHFVFNDFYQGSVMTNFGWKGFFFQAINTVRTYFQIHPNIYFLIKDNWIYLIPLILCLIISYKLFKILRTNKNLITKKENHLKIFIKVHIFIFIANYLFAFYNAGNVEFMVMLPFLLVLYIAIKYTVNNKISRKIVMLLFVWNFSYGIFPNYKYDYYNDIKLVNFMIENKEKTFIVKNHTVISQYFYESGIDNPKNIFRFNKINEDKLNQIMKANNEIYTDVITKPEILNKEKISSNGLKINFKNYRKDEVFSYDGFYGKTTVHKILQENTPKTIIKR
jgi:hypothetical protein